MRSTVSERYRKPSRTWSSVVGQARTESRVLHGSRIEGYMSIYGNNLLTPKGGSYAYQMLLQPTPAPATKHDKRERRLKIGRQWYCTCLTSSARSEAEATKAVGWKSGWIPPEIDTAEVGWSNMGGKIGRENTRLDRPAESGREVCKRDLQG